MNGLTKALKRFGRGIKRNSSEIMLITGAVGTVAATVTAVIQTRKLDSALDDARDEILYAEEKLEEEVITSDEAKRIVRTARIHEGLAVAKLYAGPVILEGLGLGLIFASHAKLKKENTALSAALATVSGAFLRYRERVRERYGEEAEREIKYGIKHAEVETEETDEKGRTKKVKKDVAYIDNLPGDYSRFFDGSSRRFDFTDNQFNISYLNSRQNYWNDMLKINGYVTLNEVYRDLDIPVIPDGIVLGWMYSKDPEKQIGKPYIDFGIWNVNRAKNRDFINGYEEAILLDFDVIDLTKAYPGILRKKKNNA